MRRRLLLMVVIGVAATVWVAATSSADTSPPPSPNARARALHCQANEPVLTAIAEPAVGEAASSSPEEALDTLLAESFPGVRAQRDKFERRDEAADSARFDFVNAGKRQMTVVIRAIGDQWFITTYTLCSRTIPRGR